ncbi:hypothetical protein EV714DRAFT_221842, partial [Schizophyllum commune]
MFRVEEVVSKLGESCSAPLVCLIGLADIESTLSHLPVAKEAQAGSTKGCLPNTRVQLLTQIMDWIFDPTGARCLILYGAAGKGKSAVAHSVARILAEMGGISPFFAFDRTDLTRRAHQLYPTLAEKLARYDEQYMAEMRSLGAERLATIDIADQRAHLLLSALRHCTSRVPTVFVVDALDECPQDSDKTSSEREVLMHSLQACIADEQLHHNIRFFITTRP